MTLVAATTNVSKIALCVSALVPVFLDVTSVMTKVILTIAIDMVSIRDLQGLLIPRVMILVRRIVVSIVVIRISVISIVTSLFRS